MADEVTHSVEPKVFLIIDGPNALGKDYGDRLDLKKVCDYAYSLDKTAKLHYATKLHNYPISKSDISKLGYKILESHKDVDHLIKDEIREKLQSTSPPNIILLGTKDHDYLDFIKEIKGIFHVKVVLVISSNTGLAQSLIPVVDDIKFFPEPIESLLVDITKLTKKGTYMAQHPDGRIIFITSAAPLTIGEKVHIQITAQNPKKTVYFATTLEKSD